MKNFLVATAVTLFILILLSSIWYFKSINSNENTKQDNSTNDGKYNFSLETQYIDNNQWEYTVKGELSNPCYDVNVEEIIMESYPEQVDILVEVEEPEKDTICIQVINSYVHKGTFSASENAKISLEMR